MPKVSVVIPSWNRRDPLDACLTQLKKQTLQDFETIVVDNGSDDGSADMVAAKYPDVLLIRHQTNKGFAGGVNPGIRAAKGEFIALLNNDALAEPEWLEQMIGTMENNPRVGFVNPKMLRLVAGKKEKLIDSAGDAYSIWGLAFPRGRDEVDKGQYDDKPEILTACGGASLYRKSMLDEIGIMDERFFAYYEDTDIALRGQLAGWKAVFNPKAVVYHEGGGTSGGSKTEFTRYHATKNLIYVYFKDMPGWLFIKYLPLFTVAMALNFLGSLKHGFLLVWFKSIGVALLHLPGILVDRFRIQNGRKVPISYIDHMLYHALPPYQKNMLESVMLSLNKRHD